MNDQDFGKKYGVLQDQWRQLAISDGCNYLSFLAPAGVVDFVLVGAVVNIDNKAVTGSPPGHHPAEPFPNFLVSQSDFILHYSARAYLCRPNEMYHITDLGKSAIPAGKAKGKRQREEFNKWYPRLLDELALVTKPSALVIPIGSDVHNFLKSKSNFGYRLSEPILHPSRATTGAATMASKFFDEEWKAFRDRVDCEDIVNHVRDLLGMAKLGHRAEEIGRRIRKAFRVRDLHYMFTYSKLMPRVRSQGNG